MNNRESSLSLLTPAAAMHRVQAGLARRYRAERRFRRFGLAAIIAGLVFVAFLFGNIISKGYPAFQQTWIELEITFTAQRLDRGGNRDRQALSQADYAGLIKDSLGRMFPDVTSRSQKRKLYRLVSSGAAFQLRDLVMAHPEIVGATQRVWVLANDDVDMLMKGHIDRALPEDRRRLKDTEIALVDQMIEQGGIRMRFNTLFFTAGDSREPELAGIRGAVTGSLLTLMVTLLLALPIGVATAVYLEEFAATNRWTDLIEVNINNLAAVPSIVFGLLGLAIFINFFGIPRSTPLLGGFVLALMTLPTIIIASRAALKSVPPSIREAALGIGASRTQMVFQHVLPLAMPGMLTGTIIGMAQALGETAPLLMIGMVAFIVDPPGGLTDPATVLPVQIYLWADSPERAFVERTSAAIMVLLAFLVLMNTLAVVLRRRFERRW